MSTWVTISGPEHARTPVQHPERPPDRMVTSQGDGHVEDQALDTDARILALLGKRQRLNVSYLVQQSLKAY